MGLRSSTHLPCTPEDGTYFVTDPESGDHLLRPDFSASLAQNAQWHDWFFSWLEKNGQQYSHRFAPAEIEKMGRPALYEKLKTTFKNLHNRYVQIMKDGGKDTPQNRAQHQSTRRKQRKIKVLPILHTP